ncbi:MAG: GNAT family N-acetyltransferase [Actinomycetota bacterium]
MDITLRPISSDELEEYVRAGSLAFGYEFNPAFVESERLVFEPERSVAAFEGDRLVGGGIAASLPLAVPGGVVPTAGLTSVAVIPTHRRRGVLSAVMQHHFEEVRERGEALSILWASEAIIYGRFGYGSATFFCRFEVERSDAGFIHEHRPAGRMRVVDRDEAIASFPAVYDRIQPLQPGMIAWTPKWWRYGYTHPEHEREGKFTFVFHESDQGPDGYVAYRFKPEFVDGSPRGTVEVEELVALTPEAYSDLWRYCFDIDLSTRIKGGGLRPEEPLLHLLAEPRRLRLRVGDGLWVRTLDVAAALEARRYAVEGRLRLAVRDALCPWNEGVWELEGGPDGAEVRPSSGEPDLELGASELGAIYLGGPRLRPLEQAGRVIETSPGAIRRADIMFSWDPPPWSPHIF